MAQELKSHYEFDIALKEIPVKLKDEKTGERWFVIRELNGDGRDTWFNDMGGRMRMNDKGDVTGVKDFKGMHAKLLELCMTEGEEELDSGQEEDNPLVRSTGKKVSGKLIQSWPSSVQDRLFEIAKQLSGLDDEAKERAKNG